MSGEAAAAASRGALPSHPIRSDLARLGRLAWPVVVSRLGVMTMGLTDTIVVGRHSAVELGYMALGWAASGAFLGSAMGLLSGVQVMASRATGEGDSLAAGAALRRGLVYALWIGLGTAALIALAAPALLGAVGLRGSLASGATGPALVLAASMPSFAVSVAASSWLEGLGRMTPPMALMWAANLLNLGIDLVLVPGGFGLPALGAMGATTATFTARTFLAVATLAYIALMPGARALGVFRKPERSRAAEIEQRRIGYGAAASNFFEMGAFSGLNVIAGWISPAAVAAWALTVSVVALIFMVPAGLSTATAVLVGRAYGAVDRVGLKRAAAVGFAVTAVFGLAIGLITWPFVRQIAALYTYDAQTVALAAGALSLCVIFYLPDGLQVVVAQALRARGDVLAPTLTHLTSYIVVMLPLAWWLAIPLGWGIAGITWAIVISAYISAGLLLTRFWMLARRD
jgi:multidrug resistance protein, MATE family